jgi:hypothetical protein
MSLIKKSDVKTHLSTQSDGRILSFKPQTQPDATGYSGDGVRGANVGAVTSNEQSSPLSPASTTPEGLVLVMDKPTVESDVRNQHS